MDCGSGRATCHELPDGSDHRLLSSAATVKRRKFWLLAASALTPLSLGVSEPASAACSGVFTVNCTADTYTSPINVPAGPAQPIVITLEPGVIVSLSANRCDL